MRKMLLVLAAVGCASAAVHAEERASAQDAKVLLDKAVAYYNASGRDKALGDFSNKTGSFVDRDLYVFCFSTEKKVSAHGGNQALIGKEIAIFKDANGKPFATEMYDAGMSKGSGSIEYTWVHPTTKKIEPKSTYFQKVGSDICAVGFYK